MKVILVSVVLAVAVALAAGALVDEYDFDGMLESPEKTESHMQCFLGKRDCGDLEKLKGEVLERLQKNCGDCNTEQRTKYERVLGALKDKYPQYYSEIEKIIKKN